MALELLVNQTITITKIIWRTEDCNWTKLKGPVRLQNYTKKKTTFFSLITITKYLLVRVLDF